YYKNKEWRKTKPNTDDSEIFEPGEELKKVLYERTIPFDNLSSPICRYQELILNFKAVGVAEGALIANSRTIGFWKQRGQFYIGNRPRSGEREVMAEKRGNFEFVFPDGSSFRF